MKARPVFSRHLLLFIIILALSSQACSLSLLQWPTSTTNTPAPGGPAEPAPTPAPRAQVTFTVRLPEPLLPNEILNLSILDEVTGPALNPVDYQMSIVDANTYTTSLAIPDRAVIKYRYVRNEPSRLTEATKPDTYIRHCILL